MKRLKTVLAITTLSGILTLGACKKESSNTNIDTTSVTDNAIAENESDKVFDAVNSVVIGNGAGKLSGAAEAAQDSMFSPCATVTIDTSSSVRIVTVDFGAVPCQCINWDNKYRQGKIVATWSGAYRDSGTVITITTQEYYAGYSATTMNKFEYLKTVTNMGHNVNGNIHFAIEVPDATILLYSGQTITWQSIRDREWIEGESTLWPFDDVYLITGGGSGVDRNGNPFTISITNALKVKFCPWIVSGIVDITHGSLPTKTLDYGNGDCDDLATITVDGQSHTIHL